VLENSSFLLEKNMKPLESGYPDPEKHNHYYITKYALGRGLPIIKKQNESPKRMEEDERGLLERSD